MSMKLHIAADVIAKGLDRTIPHSKLGPDGMLAVPEVQGKASAVVAIFEADNKLELVTVEEVGLVSERTKTTMNSTTVVEEKAKEVEPEVTVPVEASKTTKAVGKQTKGLKNAS